MKKLRTYFFRTALTIFSFYFLGKEIWYGNEGIHQCRIVQNEITLLEQKRTKLLMKIHELNHQLSLWNDPEFCQEYSMREKDLKQKGDIIYLI